MAAVLLLSQAAWARNVEVTVDGKLLEVSSYAENGITYTPLVPLLEAVGGWETSWDPAARTATANVDLFALSVPVGKRYVVADGSPFDLSAASLIRGGRTYVPLRSFANLLGVEVNFVNWNVPVALSTGKAASYTDDDLYWLSRIISAESQGESLTGQIAVGNVVLNRVASSQFPNTIKAVIFDTKDAVQFEPTANGTVYNAPSARSVLAARLVLNGANVVEDCMYFFNPSLSQGTWIRQNCTYYTTIGCHQFYR